ncbi:unnamed protein product [Oikopleura dioica]|uniref:Uncharacterized protein n=1 Tax=Oikopleura dioica TaxID=34765 RepID=E4XMZ3_OIKDI|nr:unnamed protein product [Oikopleura dioica]
MTFFRVFYLIILRNIRGDASMIVLNQVLKDLSHQNWVIQNIALFTLVTISQVSEEEIVDYDTVERSILATIKSGNLRAGTSALVNLQSGKWINKVAQLIIQFEDSQAAINFIRFALRREPALLPRAHKIFLNILASDLEKKKAAGPSHKWRKISLAILDYLEIFENHTLLPSEVSEVFRKAVSSKNLLTIAYFSILLLLEEDDLDEDIFKFHLQRHQGDSTVLSKIISKFPRHSLLFFNKFLHLSDAAILSAMLRFTALNEQQLSGVFELYENQILTRSGRVSSAQLDVAFLLARSSAQNASQRVKSLLKSEITTEQFSDFEKRLAHSSSDFIALEKLSINTVPS